MFYDIQTGPAHAKFVIEICLPSRDLIGSWYRIVRSMWHKNAINPQFIVVYIIQESFICFLEVVISLKGVLIITHICVILRIRSDGRHSNTITWETRHWRRVIEIVR